MNSSYDIGNIEQYYTFVDFLREKSLLTNAISGQIKADLRNLSFKDLSPLDLIDVARQDNYDGIPSIQLYPENFTSKNFICNGKFTHWQFGDTVEYQGGSAKYFADHWFGRRGGFAHNLIVSKVNSGEGDRPAMRLSRVKDDENIGEIGIAQLINSAEVVNLAGKTFMLAAKVRAGSGYSAIAKQLTITVFCSNNSNQDMPNPFTLGTDSQVIAINNTNLTQNWSSCVMFGQIPPTTKKVMVSFRTEKISNKPASTQDYFEITDIELKV
jgi:hypothetical protein